MATIGTSVERQHKQGTFCIAFEVFDESAVLKQQLKDGAS